MSSTDYVIDGKIGIDLTATYLSASAGSTTALFPAKPGDTVRTNNNGKYVFARAESTISTNMAVIFGFYGDTANTSSPILRAVPITTTNAAVGTLNTNMVGVAQTSIDSGRYGWFQLEGLGQCNLLIAAQPRVTLFTTATAGSLDDTTISASYIAGIMALTSATSASAPLCWMHDMHVLVMGAG